MDLNKKWISLPWLLFQITLVSVNDPDIENAIGPTQVFFVSNIFNFEI